MQPRSLEQRVISLEEQMQELQDLPKRFDKLETRFDKLETRFDNLETRFDNLETRFDNLETRFGGVETRLGVVESQIVQLRTHMNVEFSAIRGEMKTGFAELGTQMRMLHEEALARIATMAESRQPTRKRP